MSIKLVQVQREIIEMQDHKTNFTSGANLTNFGLVGLPAGQVQGCNYDAISADEIYQTNAFAISVFFAIFIAPSFLLTIFYGRIYVEAHKNSQVHERV